MIKTKEDLKYYLQQDALALRIKGKKRPALFRDHVWRFEILLRKCEYYYNLERKGLIRKAIGIAYRFRFRRMSIKLGFSIPLNAFGEGLAIMHYGTLIVNSKARIGKNCCIHTGVTIGATNGDIAAPQIGDNVFIATGAKIIGDITIADDVAIGANAVVVRSIEESGTTWGGVPSKKISNNDSHSNLSPLLF